MQCEALNSLCSVQLTHLHEDLLELYNVGVLQLPQQGDLPDGGGGNLARQQVSGQESRHRQWTVDD